MGSAALALHNKCVFNKNVAEGSLVITFYCLIDHIVVWSDYGGLQCSSNVANKSRNTG